MENKVFIEKATVLLSYNTVTDVKCSLSKFRSLFHYAWKTSSSKSPLDFDGRSPSSIMIKPHDTVLPSSLNL